MRIVHVVQRFHPAVGGAETHVRALAREQARRGHDVTVVTTGEGESQLEGVRASDDRKHGTRGQVEIRDLDGVRVVRFPVTRRFRGDYLFPPWLPMPACEPFLRASGAAVLHAHGYRFATVEHAAAASRNSSIPLVVTAHGFYPPENALVALSRARYDRARGRAALAQAARCVAVTRHEIAHYEALGVAPERVDVVPNGVDDAAFEPGNGKAFRERYHLKDGPLVVFLARLAHDKGLFDLVRAARGLDATVAVCGRDAGALAKAERLAPDNVRFLGPVDDPRDAYAAADVFCLPSHYEAFGLVLIEAMAQGRPVVATTAGGMPEVVADAGVLVPPRDPRALRDALAALLVDPAARASRGARGRERARGFSWRRVVDQLEGTYRRAIVE